MKKRSMALYHEWSFSGICLSIDDRSSDCKYCGKIITQKRENGNTITNILLLDEYHDISALLVSLRSPALLELSISVGKSPVT